MTTERIFPSGAWRCSDIVGDRLVQHVYYGYTKAEARAEFRELIRSLR